MAKKNAPSDSGSFTDIRRVKELVALMADNGLTEIELVEDKSRIVLRRGTMSGGSSVSHAQGGMSYAPMATHAAPPTHAPAAQPSAESEDARLISIKSPMVGTFYSAPNPETDAFVSIGKVIDEKTVVCMIEAMKVFNEIHAEVSGSIAKILVANGQAVEFGQPLFLVKPA